MDGHQVSRDHMKTALVEAVREWKNRHNEIATLHRIQAAVPRNVGVCHIGGYKHHEWAEPEADKLLAEMKRIINSPTFVVRPVGGGPAGWDAALRVGNPELLWESLVFDQRAAYAPLFSDVERANVAQAIANSYRLFAGLGQLPANE